LVKIYNKKDQKKFHFYFLEKVPEEIQEYIFQIPTLAQNSSIRRLIGPWANHGVPKTDIVYCEMTHNDNEKEEKG
jgi:hypothetical protein